MTRLDIASTVRGVLVSSLGPSIATVDAPSRATVATWDSLKHMEIVFAVEEALDVRFADADLVHLTSLHALVARAEVLCAA